MYNDKLIFMIPFNDKVHNRARVIRNISLLRIKIHCLPVSRLRFLEDRFK